MSLFQKETLFLKEVTRFYIDWLYSAFNKFKTKKLNRIIKHNLWVLVAKLILYIEEFYSLIKFDLLIINFIFQLFFTLFEYS